MREMGAPTVAAVNALSASANERHSPGQLCRKEWWRFFKSKMSLTSMMMWAFTPGELAVKTVLGAFAEEKRGQRSGFAS
jgi:hypothetical protein